MNWLNLVEVFALPVHLVHSTAGFEKLCLADFGKIHWLIFMKLTIWPNWTLSRQITTWAGVRTACSRWSRCLTLPTWCWATACPPWHGPTPTRSTTGWSLFWRPSGHAMSGHLAEYLLSQWPRCQRLVSVSLHAARWGESSRSARRCWPTGTGQSRSGVPSSIRNWKAMVKLGWVISRCVIKFNKGPSINKLCL